jgi:hypothetical protein
MSSVRPCFACTRENPSDAVTCEACGGELRAHARAGSLAVKAVRSLPRVRAPLVVAALAVALMAAASLVVVRWDIAGRRRPAAASWSEPETIAAWALARMRQWGVAPSSLEAVVETRTRAPRRVLVTSHSPGQDPSQVVASVAKLLVEARRDGERTSAHLAVMRFEGGEDAPALPTAYMPVGDARWLVDHPEDVEAWLERAGHPPRAPATTIEPPAGAGDATTAVSPAATPESSPVATPTVLAPAAPAPAETSAPAGSVILPPAGVASAGAAPSDASAAADKAIPPVRLLRGPGPPAATQVRASETNVVMLRVQLHPGSRRALILQSLSVKSSGSASEVEDVSFAHLVQDVDKDGRRGARDRQVGSPEAFGDDDGTATFTGLDMPFGADGAPLYLLVAFDFNDATQGGTLMASVPETGVVVREVASDQQCPVAGTLQGALVTLDGNVEPDPVQQRLDELAAEGGDQ